MTEGQSLRRHAELQKHHVWRKQVREELPSLAARVFALRGKSYPGAGFGWARERSLGKLIALVSDFDTRPNGVDQIVMEIIYEELVADLAADEKGCA